MKLSAAGKLFLEDARRILQEVNEAAMRAAQVARGLSGTLRVGFSENASWRGVVPDSFRQFREQQPDAKLQLQPAASLEQFEAISDHVPMFLLRPAKVKPEKAPEENDDPAKNTRMG